LYLSQNTFDIKLGLTKAERLRLGESAMTHAMVISGVHLDPVDGRPVRYKVENSWGPGVGDHGYFVMTDAWFDEFVVLSSFFLCLCEGLIPWLGTQIRVSNRRPQGACPERAGEGV
jgi:aminopeptidase C